MALFEKAKIGGLILKNRLIRSATFEGLGSLNGQPTPLYKDLYIRLAQGGVGAIITGYAGISSDARSFPTMCMIDSDSLIPSYAKITEALKPYKVPVILQIAQAGGLAINIGNKKQKAPSRIRYRTNGAIAQALTDNEIQDIIEQFVAAIIRAKKAGFDGVQLHAAHGYLLSAFLSPRLNQRHDWWGGTTEKRFKIIEEIYRRSIAVVGNFPILIKISGYDSDFGGMSIEEATKIAVLLQKSGCAAIEVSCGNDNFLETVRPDSAPVEAIIHFTPALTKLSTFKKSILRFLIKKMVKLKNELTNYNVMAARKIKEAVSIPVIVVGGIRNRNAAEAIILNNQADFVSMCRPFIIQPDIVKQWKEGNQINSRCLNCGYCLLGVTANPLKCYFRHLPKETS